MRKKTILPSSLLSSTPQIVISPIFILCFVSDFFFTKQVSNKNYSNNLQHHKNSCSSVSTPSSTKGIYIHTHTFSYSQQGNYFNAPILFPFRLGDFNVVLASSAAWNGTLSSNSIFHSCYFFHLQLCISVFHFIENNKTCVVIARLLDSNVLALRILRSSLNNALRNEINKALKT